MQRSLRNLEAQRLAFARFPKGRLIMEKDGKTTSIPWHSGQEIAKSTLQSIKKQTGVRFK